MPHVRTEGHGQRGYFSLENMNIVYDARNCDIAAYFLAKRWPDRYTFDFSPGLSVREHDRVECENVWRRLHRLKPLPLPPAPAITVTPDNANEVTSIEWATNSAKPDTNFLANVVEFRGKPLDAAKLVALLDHFGAKPEPNASGLELKITKDVNLTGVRMWIRLLPGVAPTGPRSLDLR